jgi:D-alanyl-D-alanine dipeptidase
MLKYSDLIDVTVIDNGEIMTAIKSDSIITKQIDEDMRAITGEDIYIRKNVLEKLNQAAGILVQNYPNHKLQVVYGYRSLSIQKRLFDKFKSELSNVYNGVELLEAVHELIAVPDVAGHPTGGAVDIQIVDEDSEPLDFGTMIWDFEKDSYTFSPFISKEAQQNRELLRRIMIESNFAPFDGEWWHFSYGDKEWAKYHNQPNAIYEQIEFHIS